MAKTKRRTAKHRLPKGAAGARRRGKPPSERPLTAQQERFCEELAKGVCSQKEAAQRAGYSKRNAAKQASMLLDTPAVMTRLRELRAGVAKEAKVEAVDVVREWARLAFSDLRQVVEVKGSHVKMKPSAEWSDDAARAVLEVTETRNKAGGSLGLKLHPKLGALDSLGKYLGLLIDRKKVEHSGNVHVQQGEDLSALSDDELKTLKEIRDKLDAARKPASAGDDLEGSEQSRD